VEWLEGLDELSIWQASKLVMSLATDAGRVRIPMLQVKDPVTKQMMREATDNKSKGQLFYDTFFPPPHPDTMAIPQDFQYPAPWWTFMNITDEQIHRAIKKMKPYKATKSGTILNSILIHAREELVPHLGPLFQATNTLKYYPQEWATMETLVLKKTRETRLLLPNSMAPDHTIRQNGMATQQLPNGQHGYHVRETQHPPSQPLQSKTGMHHH